MTTAMKTAMATVHTTPICSSYLSVSAQVSPQITATPEKPVNNLTIVLDTSFSMVGRRIKTAQAALVSLLPSLIPQFSNVRLVLFNSEVQHFDLKSIPNHQLLDHINLISVSGGTCFQTVFNHLKALLRPSEHLSANPNTTEKIIFLSDGEDTVYLDNAEKRNRAINSFSNYLRSSPFSADVHCIGFGKDHDAALMTMLSAAGSIPGTFIYARDTKAVENAFDETFQLANAGMINGTLHLLDADGVDIVDPVAAPFALDADNCLSTSTLFVQTRRIPDKAKVKFTPGAFLDAVVVPHASALDAIYHDAASVSARATKFHQFALDMQKLMQERMMFHLTQLPIQMSDKIALQAIRAEYNSVSTEVVENLIPLAASCKSKEGKSVLLNVLSRINEFVRDVLSPAVRHGTFDNEFYAQLAHQAFAGVRETRMKTLLGKRAMWNADDIGSMDKRIDDIVKSIDFSDNALFNDVEDYGHCFVSCMDYKEAMQAGDCLCLTLEIQRPEAAIADPSRIVIQRVGTSVVTADSFLSAVTHRLGDVGSGSAESADVHGGFVLGESGIVMQGQSREVVNGALPLFINEKHWSIARLRAKPLFAWMTTLDVLGASNEQVYAIPFLVLNALQDMDDKSEFCTRITGWVSQVCTQVLLRGGLLRVRLFGENWRDDKSGEHRLQYLSDVERRLPNCVASHSVFFSQVHTARQAGLLQITEEELCTVGLYAVVEEYRRRVRGDMVVLSPSQKTQLVTKLVCSSIEQFVPAMLDVIIRQEEEDSGVIGRWKGDFDSCFKKISTRPKWKKEYVNRDGFRSVRELQLLDSIIQLFDGKIIPTASSSCLSDVQKVALVTLHVDFAQSHDVRLESRKYQRHVDLILENGSLWMRARFQKLLQTYVKKSFDAMISNRVHASDRMQGRSFAKAKSVKEVRDIVRGNLYIGRNVTQYVKGLLYADGDCESIGVLWKMDLLMNNDEAEVGRLYSDVDHDERVERFDGRVWKPNKRWVYRLFHRFVLSECPPENKVVDDDVFNSWIDVFPFLNYHISVWSGRIPCPRG